jgi:chromosomal replication initiator protein
MMRITEIVSGHTRITIPEMKGKRQKREITNARQVAMYFAFQNKMGSLAFIGKFFNRDHATVLHAVRVVNNYIVTGDPIKDTVERCRVEIDKRMSR